MSSSGRAPIRAFAFGLRAAGRQWRLLLLLWAVNLAVALPFAAALAGEIRGSVGHSLVAEDLLAGWDAGWHGEFRYEAGALADTFGGEVLGAGAFFENLERWWKGDLLSLPPALVTAGLLYALLWAFLLGGVLDRLVAGPEGRSSFWTASGRYLFRFVRLALLSGVLYYLIYRLVRAGFGALEEAARDVTSERTVLLWVLAGVALTILLLAAVRVVFDYAKIAVVAFGAERRRSALAAAWDGLRFVASHPFATLGLYGAFALLGALLLSLYALLPPFTGAGTWPTVLLAALVPQLALAGKIALRVSLLAAESRLYGRHEAPSSAPSPGAVDPAL